MGETKEHDEVAMPRMSTSRKTVRTYRAPKHFTAYVYEEDFRKIRELVQPYANIETGGDLFGLWQDQSTVISDSLGRERTVCVQQDHSIKTSSTFIKLAR